MTPPTPDDFLRAAGRDDVLQDRERRRAEEAETEAVFQAALADVDPEVVADLEASVALPDGRHNTDGGNADRLIGLHGHHLRHVAVWRKWVVWDGCRWAIDYGDRLVLGRARDVVGHLIRLAATVEGKERALVLVFATRTESSRQLRALVDVAASARQVALDHEQLDADGWLLNLGNGTLDLRTGQLHQHRPEDLLTLLAGTDYDEHATAPTFDAFLRRVLPDDEVRAYVQSRLGAALVGEVSDHELHIATGPGANGKTTLFQIIDAVLGDYAVVAPKSLLIASRHEHHPTDRTRLFRRRLAYAGEIPEGAQLNEALVKELTGGDRITARRMREDFWSFDPSHHLWMFANNLPHVSGTDHGIWRRLRVVRFEVTIPDTEQDPGLADKIIATEAPGVLAWLIEGCRLWQSGLPAPAAVRHATQDYRHGEDMAEQFITSELVLGQGREVWADDLWAAHAAWCNENGVEPHLRSREVQRVAAILRARGCDRARRRDAPVISLGGTTTPGRQRTVWFGVDLGDGPEEERADRGAR
jgi:putative DNA primase/helicase